MASILDIRARRKGERVTLSLVGELDYDSSSDLVCRLSQAIHPGASVVLDLRSLAFIDAAGVETLRRAALWAAEDGWSLAITGAPGPVQRVFRLTGADGVLPLAG